MKNCRLSFRQISPEPDEVLEDAADDVDAVDQRVAEKEQEELVVGEGDAVVHL